MFCVVWDYFKLKLKIVSNKYKTRLKSQLSDRSFQPYPTPFTEMSIGAITVWETLPVIRRFHTASVMCVSFIGPCRLGENALKKDLSALADKSISTGSPVFFFCTYFFKKLEGSVLSVLLQVGLSRSPSDYSNVLFLINLSVSFSNLSFQLFVVFSVSRVVPWGGVLPYMVYKGRCGPK